MKYLFAAVLVAGSFASFSAANAAGGCGPGWHRGPYGGCVANRGVVVRGPYCFVRHPIYLGYVISHVAFFLAQPTLWNAAVILIGDGTLIVRALMEERVLSGDSEYASYCRRVSWHLVPGVF